MAASVSSSLPTADEAGAQAECFHCGLPVPAQTDYAVMIDQRERLMCCPGCQTVAQAIVAAGLEDYYRHRTETAQKQQAAVPDFLCDAEIYDRPEIQRDFVHSEDDNIREASLILEGLTCAACAWLNERHIGALDGVLEFRVNYATHRAQVRWDTRAIRFSEIIAAIAAIGYKAHPFDPRRQEAVHRNERAAALRRLAVAGLGAMQVMMLAVALYAGDYYGMEEHLRRFLRWISLGIATPVLLYSAQPFVAAAWRDLKLRQVGMDTPVSIALLAAFSASVWNTWHNSGEIYFDSATMFVFFLLTARFLEMNARHNSARVVEERARLLPNRITRLQQDGSEETIAVAELQPGDRVLIRPGETVPADGRIDKGSSSVDEALLSGESLPLVKQVGDPLFGGSVNVESPLVMEVEKTGADTVLSAIVRLLERAQSEKPQIALLANRVAAGFISVILLLAVAVAWWWAVHDADAAFRITLSVLVVSCPCALALATPTALTAATSALSRVGLLTSRGTALETLAHATHIVFDKTGTLTHGQLALSRVQDLRHDRDHALRIAAALERGSEHPIAKALTGVVENPPVAVEQRNYPGRGVEAVIGGFGYRLGTADFVGELSPSTVASNASNTTRILLGDRDGPIAWFEFSDTVRPEAAACIADLNALGLKVILLSGDREPAVRAIAAQLGIDDAQGGLLPQDKLARVKALQAQGAIVAMVGDGINDAPVLAAAQVSVAMGGGTQLAHASADMILLVDKLDILHHGIVTARRSFAVIRQNFAWALGYNLIAIPLAAMGWVAPWMAALGMSLSSLIVVANATRLAQQ